MTARGKVRLARLPALGVQGLGQLARVFGIENRKPEAAMSQTLKSPTNQKSKTLVIR